MPAAKTRPTREPIERYLVRITDPAKRADCAALLALMRRATGEPPVMWGTGIVGFGRYAYTYASGEPGSSCAVGFAARRHDLSVYLMATTPTQPALLARLGRHRMGKACLSIRRLADVDLNVLEQLVTESFAEIMRRHPSPAADD